MYIDEVIREKEKFDRKMQKEEKERLILEALAPRFEGDQWAAYTRPELARMTGLARTTTHDVIERLVSQGKIECKAIAGSGPGRPSVFYRLPV